MSIIFFMGKLDYIRNFRNEVRWALVTTKMIDGSTLSLSTCSLF